GNPPQKPTAPPPRTEVETPTVALDTHGSGIVLEPHDNAESLSVESLTSPHSKVTPGRRNPERRTPQRLNEWTREILKKSSDPIAAALRELLANGAQDAPFLSMKARETPAPVPLFVATAAVGSKEQLVLWTGLQWDPQ